MARCRPVRDELAHPNAKASDDADLLIEHHLNPGSRLPLPSGIVSAFRGQLAMFE